MLIIGCDYHPGFQQIAFVDTETGEAGERRLTHREEAEQFYRHAQGSEGCVVGMEASGHARWFERLLNELQFELWIGDAAEIRTKRVRKQKTDRQDAQLLLKLMMEDRFPRIWVAGCRESGSAATAVASASAGADAHAHHESVACGGSERRSAAQESAVAAGWSQRTGIVSARSMGTPTSPRPARLTRPTDSEDPGLDASARRGSGEAASGAATDDPSRSGSADGLSLRVGDWNSRTLSLRQANRQLCGSGSFGRVQRRSATAGTHQQARQRAAAVSCWWKRRRSRCAVKRSGAASSSTWPCAEDGRSRR